MSGGATPVAAAPAEGVPRLPANGPITRYVAVTGTDQGTGITACITPTDPCQTLQHAIDEASSGDEILVSTGVYTSRGADNVADIGGSVLQALAIRGGYSTDFSSWDPDTYPVTLDGEGERRVVNVSSVAVSGGATVTLEALDVINGATGAVSSNGAGVLATGSELNRTHLIISGCQVYSNTAFGHGGGVYVLYGGEADIVDSRVFSNAAAYGGGVVVRQSIGVTLQGNEIFENHSTGGSFGGGGILALFASGLVVSRNDIYSNTSAASGGGIYFNSSAGVALAGNDIYSNTAASSGGGVAVGSAAASASLADNSIYGNTANFGGGIAVIGGDNGSYAGNEVFGNTADVSGGGLHLNSSDGASLIGNRILDNTADSCGGGLDIVQSDGVTLVNNWVAGNGAASSHGAGIYARGSSAVLLHNTIARNSGGDGSGVFVEDYGSVLYSTVAFTNTIIVSHTVGVTATAGNTVALHSTFWGSGDWSNGTDWGGPGVSSEHNYDGDAGFIDYASFDYHIGSQSAARDAGVDAGVSDDIDGEARPFGAAPDIGADEVQCHVRIGSTYYATVQDAVDDASYGDLIEVAGTCYARAYGNPLVNITERVKIRGGYSADFLTWDPDSYPTTLDALQHGSVVRISGGYSSTLEALRLTNGSSSNGGGIDSTNAHPVISGCQILKNHTSGSGGGVFLSDSDNAVLVNSAVLSNTADSGMKLGGGLFVQGTSGLLMANNIFADNWVGSGGAGSAMWLGTSQARLWHTTVARNSGGNGSGIRLVSSTGEFTNTIIVSHTVGVETIASSAVTLTATLWGSGAWANGSDTSGTGIVSGTNYSGDPTFVDPDGLDYHLDGASDALDKGVATILYFDIDRDPRSVGPLPDLGADEAVPVLALTKVGPALADPGALITYTLALTNSGVVTSSNTVLTDVVPIGAFFVASSSGSESGGVVTWTSFDLLAGETISHTFTVTATQSITNTTYMATALGMPGLAGTVPVYTAVEYRVYLPLVLRNY